MRKEMTHRTRVARNFVRKYGVQAFRRLIEGFQAGESHQVLSAELGVSRERVRQWRNLMGETIRVYNVYPEVKKYLP